MPETAAAIVVELSVPPAEGADRPSPSPVPPASLAVGEPESEVAVVAADVAPEPEVSPLPEVSPEPDVSPEPPVEDSPPPDEPSSPGEEVGSSSQSGVVKVVLSRVTAPLRASARPSTVVPVPVLIDVSARIVPTKVVPVPRVAELPTYQNTWQLWAPLTREIALPEAVVSAEPI